MPSTAKARFSRKEIGDKIVPAPIQFPERYWQLGTVKRRKRHQRGVVTESQLTWLTNGFAIGGSGFANEVEERAGWERLRNTLMAEHEPGRRPCAFFKFDLNLNPAPRHWHEEISALMDANLIDPHEAAAIEARFPMLSPAQTAEYCCSYDSLEAYHGANGYYARPGPWTQEFHASMAKQRAKFELAARWHKWRGRQDTAALYSRRAGVAQVLVELHPEGKEKS
jgi:hypothetical protein